MITPNVHRSEQHRTGKVGASRLIAEGDFDIVEAAVEAAGVLTDKPVVLINGHSHAPLNTGGPGGISPAPA